MKKVIILFKGSDCVPCTHFEPVFDEIVEECDVQHVYKFVDDIDLMRQFGIRQVPAVVFAHEVEPGVFENQASIIGKDLRKGILRVGISMYLGD